MSRKKAVFFGAGSIGRGFLGQLLTQGGYEIVFVDVDKILVDRLNAARSYPLLLLSDEQETELTVAPVRAVHAQERELVADEIAGADLLGTAVGAHALRFVVPTLAAGLRRRWASNDGAIDVLLCENLIHVDAVVRELLKAEMTTAEERARLGQTVGLVETSIGRMVPVPSADSQRGDPLRVCAEPYAELPVDAAAFRAPLPALPGLVAYSPFHYYVERKLFVHNLGHAVASYLGTLLGYTFVWEATADPWVLGVTRTAMFQAAAALAAEHGVPVHELQDHALDLLRRFANRGLGDTLERVCKDPLRKLAPNDRLIGALTLCRRHRLPSTAIAAGAAAAIVFHVKESGGEAKSLLAEHCGLTPQSPDFERVLSTVVRLSEGKNPLNLRDLT